MKYFQIFWIDPLFSVLIAVYLLYLSWDIFKSSLKIMMQYTPDNIDVNKINTEVSAISGVKNLHHIHVWQINEHDIMFEAHLDLENNITISEFEKVMASVQKYLHDNYEIHHVTLQPEFSVDDNKELIKTQ